LLDVRGLGRVGFTSKAPLEVDMSLPAPSVLTSRNHMKTFVSVFLGLGLSLSSSLAQLAIYNFTSTHNIVGSDYNIKSRSTGVLIFELEGRRAVRVSKFTADPRRDVRVAKFNAGTTKFFAVADEPNFKRWRALQLEGANTMAVSRYVTATNGVSREGATFASGKDDSVNIGNQTYSLPKNLDEAGYNVIDLGGGFVNAMTTISSTHTYSPKQTIAANTQHQTIDQVVEGMRQSLIADGYTEIVP
jgi:hypothetical protein